MFSIVLIVVIGVTFLVIERIHSGRTLPYAKGWYARAILLNAVQFSMVFLAGATWNRWFQEWSLLQLGGTMPAVLEGFFYWFVGTFLFYWWHRLRHKSGWWLVFHQVHHSPTRIEALTAFYKHPIEMVVNSVIISAMICVLFGGSLEAAAWYNIFAVVGEFMYHMNVRTPQWIGWFIQRPEQHSLHHERDVHTYNFGDITWWDRLFGTFKEATTFAKECGYTDHREEQLARMLTFHDVNKL